MRRSRPKSRPPPTRAWKTDTDQNFNVDDIEAAASRAHAGGGEILMGPHQVPGGDWIAQCRDPQGALFSMVGPRRE